VTAWLLVLAGCGGDRSPSMPPVSPEPTADTASTGEPSPTTGPTPPDTGSSSTTTTGSTAATGRTGTTGDTGSPEPFDPEAWWESAGPATADAGNDPFDQLRVDLPLEALAGVSQGRELFAAPWVVDSTVPSVRDGLGPLFHASSCLACHPTDGRAAAFDAFDNVLAGVLFRLRRTDGSDDPVYGGQLQPAGIAGVDGESALSVVWSEEAFTWADGATVTLRRPTWIPSPTYGPLDAATELQPRLSPQLVGMGFLEAIDPGDLYALADPDDLDGDGISGRVAELATGIGRFGWKATETTVRSQSAAAFSGDVGITNPLHPDPACTEAQTACIEAAAVELELDDDGLDHITAYQGALTVPARRLPAMGDPSLGIQLFHQVGCASCHVPELITAADAPDHLASVRISPYTDLLLHDMGPDLAEAVGVGAAEGSEWRTPPLWGIGLVDAGSGARFLHDGRAATLEEAIAWHGGEAEAARDAFSALPEHDRLALLELLSLL